MFLSTRKREKFTWRPPHVRAHICRRNFFFCSVCTRIGWGENDIVPRRDIRPEQFRDCFLFRMLFIISFSFVYYIDCYSPLERGRDGKRERERGKKKLEMPNVVVVVFYWSLEGIGVMARSPFNRHGTDHRLRFSFLSMSAKERRDVLRRGKEN